jgi:DNA-binding NarL/FixJ family response regulator
VPPRVVLIEDNDVFREALELLLTMQGDIEVVASEPEGSRVVDLCRGLRPDVLIVDYRLPALDGVQLTRLVRERCPDVAVVALTAAAEPRETEALLEAGAVACVRKDEPLQTIIEAVRRAAGTGAG